MEQVFAGPAENYRCRTEFAIWHDDDGTNYVMYEQRPDKSKPQRVNIQQYPVASKLINSMMPIVMQNICSQEILRRKLFQVIRHIFAGFHLCRVKPLPVMLPKLSLRGYMFLVLALPPGLH